jgi:hypothetical protein
VCGLDARRAREYHRPLLRAEATHSQHQRALPNEYRGEAISGEGDRGTQYRETIIGDGSIGKTLPDDGFPILPPPDVSLTHIGTD